MAIIRCDGANVNEILPHIRKPRLGNALKGGVGHHWQWRLSLAEWVLKLAGLVETRNPVINKVSPTVHQAPNDHADTLGESGRGNEWRATSRDQNGM
jgi:hypothetical protein